VFDKIKYILYKRKEKKRKNHEKNLIAPPKKVTRKISKVYFCEAAGRLLHPRGYSWVWNRNGLAAFVMYSFWCGMTFYLSFRNKNRERERERQKVLLTLNFKIKKL